MNKEDKKTEPENINPLETSKEAWIALHEVGQLASGNFPRSSKRSEGESREESKTNYPHAEQNVIQKISSLREDEPKEKHKLK